MAPPMPGTTLVAHRGFAAERPENTLCAVRATAGRASMVELDVRRCGSGEVVVFHDATVDRVTNATGPLTDFSADELASLDVLDSGEGIPTLQAALDALPDGVGINVELKETEVTADALERVTEADVEALVSAFDPDALRTAREVAPDVPRALLFSRRPRRHLDTARDLGCEAVNPAKWLCLRSTVVRRAHAAGMAVNAWTVDRPRMGSVLRRAGVDGLIADRADV